MFLQSVDPMDMIGHAAMCGAVLCLHSRDQIVVHPDGIFRLRGEGDRLRFKSSSSSLHTGDSDATSESSEM